MEQADSQNILELEVVRGGPREGSGRRLYMTPRRFIRIMHLLEHGESPVHACQIEGCTYASFRSHVNRNPIYAKRLKKAEAVRELWLREYHIQNLKDNAARSISASMFWLERRYPNEFALRNFVRVNPDAKPAELEIPAEALARHRALMLELAREDETKQAQAVQIEDRPKEAELNTKQTTQNV